MKKNLKTTQDHLPITQKTHAYWSQSIHPMHSYAANIAGMAFIMDAALAFIPLTFNKMFFTDTGAVSSLEFSLRFFSPDIKMEEWALNEQTTERGVCCPSAYRLYRTESQNWQAQGKTFSHGRHYDCHGNLIATMSQHSIMRPRPSQAPAKL